MLEYLRIQDLALIEDMELEFGSGVNVLSGETGAGKSFILKALNFLTGDRLEADLVRPGKEKASAEAVFVTSSGEELLIRRELAADSGRSRLFINDRLSSQESVRELKPALLLHTSQHGQQKLLQPAFQGKILDDFMNRPDLFAERDEALRALLELLERRRELERRFGELEAKRDLLEFQRQEIDKINPRENEEDELEARRQALKRDDAYNMAVEQALGALYGDGASSGSGRGGGISGGLLDGLGSLERAVKQLAALDEGYATDVQALAEFYPTLSDLASRLRQGDRNSGRKASSHDAEAIEKRLFALSQLKRKLKRSLPEVLALRGELIENLDFLDSCALDLKQLGREEYTICERLSEVLSRLNPARREAATQLKALLEAELRDLGFSEQVQVEFVFTARELHPGRAGSSLDSGSSAHSNTTEDRAQIFWKPNPGQSAQPMDKIASGGELSRFLLALVSILARRMIEAPTLIFDEVDSGVGGITLNKVADKLRDLGTRRQLILITHWPSLAAGASRHFLVRKEVLDGETYTRCTRLAGAEVEGEIARMAGGGEQGRVLARELMAGRP
ncbi:MAG: AAA family ATPase [Deltaproteobacteria bacterium]|jgi:DNA repair protein RecN (Recombination protein N)|nr:AAA family ATPase [Deltaproteobacteria bacterium]